MQLGGDFRREPASWTVGPFYKRSKLHHEHNIPQSHSYDSLQLYKAVFGFKDHAEVKQHPADVEESVLIADQWVLWSLASKDAENNLQSVYLQ